MLGFIIGIIVGSAVNMGLIAISGSVIPLPEGVDPQDVESLKANMHLLEPKHFIFPLLAHGLGTLTGACIAAKMAPKNNMVFALAIGGFFMLGGIAMVTMVPSPTWFTITDLAVCYIPKAFIGGKVFSPKD